MDLGWVAIKHGQRLGCDFSVSPWSKSFFFSFLGGLLFDLGQGLGLGLGPGLDNMNLWSLNEFL